MKVGSYFITAMRTSYYVDGEAEGYKDKLNTFTVDGRLVLEETRLFTRGVKGGEDLPSLMVE
jgi:hypothetical protein